MSSILNCIPDDHIRYSRNKISERLGHHKLRAEVGFYSELPITTKELNDGRVYQDMKYELREQINHNISATVFNAFITQHKIDDDKIDRVMSLHKELPVHTAMENVELLQSIAAILSQMRRYAR